MVFTKDDGIMSFDVEMTMVEIPLDMYEGVVNAISNNKKLGYETPEEFIREAIRHHMISLNMADEDVVDRAFRIANERGIVFRSNISK